MNNIFVAGIDGATFEIIKPAVDSGELPFIGRLLREGTGAELTSSIPPITGPAWSSFLTGKNPGKHGVFDWLTRKEGSYDLVPVNSGSIKGLTLFEIAGFQDVNTGAINVPMTYPPRKTNGFLVSGMLTPSKQRDFCYPSSLKEELEINFPEYEILPQIRYSENNISKWLEGLKNMIRKRKEVTLHLLNTRNPDLFMTHFMATDVVSHRLWHTREESPANNPVLDIYKCVDRALEEIYKALPKEFSIMIMSDHGMGPLYENIYLNTLFLNEDLLKLKDNFSTIVKYLMFKLGITPARIYTLLDKTGLLGKGLKLGKGERYNLVKKFFLSSQNINWNKTKVYSHGNIGQIYVNQKGREPQGCVSGEQKEELIDRITGILKNLEDKNRKKLIDKVYRKEQIYSGPMTRKAPDILLLPRDMEAMAVGVSEFISNKITEKSFAFSGGHRMEGVLIVKGTPFVSKSSADSPHIQDLAPTILYLLDRKIPSDMDGSVLKSLFREEYLKKRKPCFSGMESLIDTDRDFRPDPEVRERLQNLGYI